MALEIKTFVNFDTDEELYISDLLLIDGFFYILDKLNHNIKIFNEQGELKKTIGKQGGGTGEFCYPSAIAVDKDNRIFVADSYNNRVQVINQEGEFLYSFGSFGTGKNEFSEPVHIDIDLDNNLLVVDCNNHRVKKLTVDGTEILNFGERGEGQGFLNYPVSLTVDDQNNYYIIDAGNSRIQKFDSNGNYILGFGEKGNELNKLRRPSGIKKKGDFIYVTDEVIGKLVKFTKRGIFVEAYECPEMVGKIKSIGGKILICKLKGVMRLCDIDDRTEEEFAEKQQTTLVNENLTSEILAASSLVNKDFKNFKISIDKVSKFSNSFDFEMNLSLLEFLFENRYYEKALLLLEQEIRSKDFPLSKREANYFEYLFKKHEEIVDERTKEEINKLLSLYYIEEDYVIGGIGKDLGQFNGPVKIAFDQEDNFYVTEYGNHRFQKFSFDGRPIMEVGKLGPREGEFNIPAGILIDDAGKVFVSDCKNDRIQVFDTNGIYLYSFCPDLIGPSWLRMNKSDQLMVFDNKRFIYGYSKDGEYKGLLDTSNISAHAAEDILFQENDVKWYVIKLEGKIVRERNKEKECFGKWGEEKGAFIHPFSITSDDKGYIYVCDTGRFQKFDKDFNHIYSYHFCGDPILTSISYNKGKLFLVNHSNSTIHCYSVSGN